MSRLNITIGLPSAGKGYLAMKDIYRLYIRNLIWYERHGFIRPIATNFKLSPEWLADKDPRFFIYWSNWNDLLKLSHCDIVWDEISVMLDSYQYETLSISQLQWLTHYDKNGIEIYANTQHYSQLAKRVRILATYVKRVIKVMGSGRPSPAKPPVGRVWGLLWCQEMINHADDEAISEPKYNLLSLDFSGISEKFTSMYDTTQKILPDNSNEASRTMGQIKTIDSLINFAKKKDLEIATLDKIREMRLNHFKTLIEG